MACDKAEFIPEPVESLIQAGPLEAVARLQSPGAWQRTGIAASRAGCGGRGSFSSDRCTAGAGAWVLPLSLSLVGVAILAGIASLVGYRAFGIMADTRAVVIWRAGSLRSIPTEAEVSQKTTPLPAGSAAVADKSFLGWIRIRFPNGQTGWVPRSEAIYVWQGSK